MKAFILTVSLLSVATAPASAGTKIVNKTACTLQLFNENNDNAPLTLALSPLSPTLQSSATDTSYPFYMVQEQAIKVNIGAYNTWECDNYISIFYRTGLTDACVEVYTNILPTTPGESSVPGELSVRPCAPSHSASSSVPPSATLAPPPIPSAPTSSPVK